MKKNTGKLTYIYNNDYFNEIIKNNSILEIDKIKHQFYNISTVSYRYIKINKNKFLNKKYIKFIKSFSIGLIIDSKIKYFRNNAGIIEKFNLIKILYENEIIFVEKQNLLIIN